MTDRSVTHATFFLERIYDAPPARVFAAWARPQAKARWFHGPDEWVTSRYELDFREGGREHAANGPADGPAHRYDALYWEIAPDARIVSSYEMHIDARRISVSLATVEFKPAGGGTRLLYTEQGAYLDGYDGAAEREEGTRWLFDNLERELQRQTESA